MNAVDKIQQENHFLKEKIDELQSSHQQELTAKNQRIQLLEELVRSLKHRRFGASSEKASPQQNLFNEAESDEAQANQPWSDDTITVPAHTRQRKKRVSIPKDIPREEIVYDLRDDEKVCPHDGSALKAIGEETHEQLDIVPAKIKVLRHIRKKYACPCCEQYVVTAQKPKQPIEKSIAAPGLLAHIAVSKYADALPLYRQTQMFKRIGIELDRTSLANWMIQCARLVQPLVNRLHEDLLEQPVIHMDETPVQVLKEPGKTAQSQSYMWVMTSATGDNPVVLFHYASSRSQDTPNQRLADYHGALMVDGYSGYQPICDQNKLTRLGCWAHARRKFVEAQNAQHKKQKNKVGKADKALAEIQKLYRIEQQTKDVTVDERYRIRREKAKPLIDKLKKWMELSLTQVPPQSAIGKALVYLGNQWPNLIRYLEDGKYPIDNNRAENTIRPFVVGRKNWLFANSQAGASASANLYSLIETAKANECEPYAYLKAVFTQLPNAETLKEVDALLPWNVKGVLD